MVQNVMTRYVAACLAMSWSKSHQSYFVENDGSLRIPWDDTDYGDYGDDADDHSRHSSTEACNLSEAPTVYEAPESFSVREDMGEILQENSKSEFTVINGQHRNQCHHCNQFQQLPSAVEVRDTKTEETGTVEQEKQKDTAFYRNRCPHHPHAQLVRFDPAGQAWCDKLDCWDCYRLMKIGEALDYTCLKELGGKVVIDQGMPAWSDYVLTQRAFLVVVATEQAIVLCKAMGIEVPDVSGEVKRLVEVRPAPP